MNPSLNAMSLFHTVFNYLPPPLASPFPPHSLPLLCHVIDATPESVMTGFLYLPSLRREMPPSKNLSAIHNAQAPASLSDSEQII